MPRGQPDYGLTTQTPVATGISDPGEAAARRGSINVYDRRGWTVWMDDFEAPNLKWAVSSSAGSVDPVLTTADFWMGAQSLYFTTVAGAAEWAMMQRRFPLVRLGRVGIELFLLLSVKTPGYMQIQQTIYDGTNISRAQLRLDNEARTATIVTPAGNIPVATNAFNAFPNNIWTPVKLVVDVDTDHYTRLMIGPEEIDLSSHALVAVGVTNHRLIWQEIILRGDAGAIMYAWLDNFILTQNEP